MGECTGGDVVLNITDQQPSSRPYRTAQRGAGIFGKCADGALGAQYLLRSLVGVIASRTSLALWQTRHICELASCASFAIGTTRSHLRAPQFTGSARGGQGGDGLISARCAQFALRSAGNVCKSTLHHTPLQQ